MKISDKTNKEGLIIFLTMVLGVGLVFATVFYTELVIYYYSAILLYMAGLFYRLVGFNIREEKAIRGMSGLEQEARKKRLSFVWAVAGVLSIFFLVSMYLLDYMGDISPRDREYGEDIWDLVSDSYLIISVFGPLAVIFFSQLKTKDK